MKKNRVQYGLMAWRYCKTRLPLKILESPSGFYIGTFHPEDGPLSRESVEYYPDLGRAEYALEEGTWTQLYLESDAFGFDLAIYTSDPDTEVGANTEEFAGFFSDFGSAMSKADHFVKQGYIVRVFNAPTGALVQQLPTTRPRLDICDFLFNVLQRG